MSQDSSVLPPAARPRRESGGAAHRILLILSVGLTLVLGVLMVGQRSGWSLDTPQVVGLGPRAGARDVGGKEPVVVSFNMPMDQAAAQAALKIDPPTEGIFTWDGPTMIWTPSVGYQRGTTYTAELGTGARSPLFRPVSAPAQTTFRTAGLPSVYRTVPPADATGVVTGTTITIQFSQPMIALTALESQPPVGDKITIDPAPAGQWRWLGTTALGFYPEGGLRPATRYTVRVSKTFTDLAGGELERDASWSFSTPRPQVIGVDPADQEAYVKPTDPLVIRFNQAVDHASAEAGLTLEPTIAGTAQWSPASDVLTYTPGSKLPLSTPYRATVSGVRPAVGDLAQTEVYHWTFRTTPQGRVQATVPADGALLPNGDNPRITYSAPLSATSKELYAAVHLSPPVKGLNVYAYDNNTTLALYGPFAPSTNYTLTIDSTLHDLTGATVPGMTLHFHTAPLKPFAYLLDQNGVSTFYAGAPTRVYLDVVNVSQVRMALYRLNSGDTIRYLTGDDQARQTFTPPGQALRTWDLPVDRTPNRRQGLRPTLSLDGASDRLPPGFYLAEVTSPEGDPSRSVLVVGRTALTLKTSAKEYWVWAVDMGSGQPVSGRRIQAIGSEGQALGTATTGADGLAQLPGALDAKSNTPLALMEDGGDVALVTANWNNGIGTYNYDFPTYGLSGDTQGALYTERPIYRPGQTVYFKGLLRADDDGRYNLPALKQVGIVINDRDGNQVYSQTVPLGAFGTFNGEYTLATAAPLGEYAINTTTENVYLHAGFSVQEYRKPEYLVDVTASQPSVINGDAIQATAQATYFFGGPVAGAQVTERVYSSDYRFSWTAPDEKDAPPYDFQDNEALYSRFDSYNGEKQSETAATTDANGKVAWTLRTNINDAPVSQLWTLEAGVMDTSNQEVSGNTQVIVHKGAFYVGLRPDSYVNSTDRATTVRVQTVAPDGTRTANVPVQLSFFKREWEQVDEPDESGVITTQWKPKDTPVGTASVTTDAEGRAQAAFTPKEPGEYRMAATARDSRGNTLTTATYAWVSDAAGAADAISWRQTNDSLIEMIADKPEYQPGDTARILVTSPFTEAVGLLTVERGRLREHRVVSLKGGSPVIEVPIPADYLPNVYLGLSVIAPADTNPGGQPAFRQGYVPLQVDTASKALQITIQPSAAKLHPRDTVTYTITTRDAAGQPVAAEVSLAVVDKALYSLAGDDTPDPMQVFYGNRELSFQTATSLLALNTLLQPAAGGPGSKGGSGGPGAGGGGGGDFTRSVFRDTAYWQAAVTTGANGTAQVAVPLPDNLTTWRATALGLTADTQVGTATNEVVVSKDLLLQPLTPRFLMAGDKVEPGAIVHNYTAQNYTVEATLALSDALFVEGGPVAAQRLDIPAGGEATFHWSVAVSTTDSVTFHLTARALGSPGGANLTPPSDSVELTLPVQPFLVPEAVATSGEVAGDSAAQEQVFIPHGVDPLIGSLQVQVSPSLAATTGAAVSYLTTSPYESAEETISRFYPLLVLDRAYTAAGLKTPFGSDLPGLVSSGLQQLYSRQGYDGGLGWYANSPAVPWLTAYGLQAMSAARAAGVPVSDRAFNGAKGFLTDWLNGTSSQKGGGPPSWADNLGTTLNTRAYVLYALADSGAGDLALTRALAARSAGLSHYGQTYLALAFQRLGATDDAQRLLDTITSAAQQSSTEAHWEEPASRSPEDWVSMSTNTRTTALVLDALIAANKDDPLIPKAVRWLMTARREGHWVTTQETAQVLVALAHYLTASGELTPDYTWNVTLNGQAWSNGTANQASFADTVTLQKAIRDLLINTANTVDIRRTGSSGKLYYSLSLRYYQPDEGIKGRSEGLSVIREYLKPGTGTGGVPPTLLTQAGAGDLVQIRLTVIAPADAYYLLVEDPLPAGLEAINGSLATTSLAEQALQRGANPQKGTFGDIQPTYFDNVEMRDDRTALFASYLPAGVYTYSYLARATTPGIYRILPAQARLTYSPDVFGRSDGGAFVVTGR